MLLVVFGWPTAYAPAVLIVSAENGPNSHAWMAQGVRRLLFDPVGTHSIPPPSASGGRSVMVFSGESVGCHFHADDAL